MAWGSATPDLSCPIQQDHALVIAAGCFPRASFLGGSWSNGCFLYFVNIVNFHVTWKAWPLLAQHGAPWVTQPSQQRGHLLLR